MLPIVTDRLVLRLFEDRDREPFAAMGLDPAVMAQLNGVIDRATSDAFVDRQLAAQATLGHSFWAIRLRADDAFAGFCGLKLGPEGTPIAGRLEIGWRLAHAFWSHGIAREAATATIAWAWANTSAPRLHAITVPANLRSWGLMERLGMTRRPDLGFDHPVFEPGHPLSRHCTYVLDRPAR